MYQEFGPCLDKVDYVRSLHLELVAMGIEHECQVPLPLIYKGTKLDCCYRIDAFVAGWLLLELKAVEKQHPLHKAQLINCLRRRCSSSGYSCTLAASCSDTPSSAVLTPPPSQRSMLPTKSSRRWMNCPLR